MMTGVGLALGEGGAWQWSTKGLTAMAYLTSRARASRTPRSPGWREYTRRRMVGTYSYVNPAIAAVLGWWFLDEHLGANQLIGMAIMFAGVALVSWPQKK
jgi:hypothetical protein